MFVGTRRALSAVLTPNARCNVSPLTLTLPLTGEVPIRGRGIFTHHSLILQLSLYKGVNKAFRRLTKCQSVP